MKLFPPEIRKSARQRRLSRDELALWRHVIADVTPRKGRVAPEAPPESETPPAPAAPAPRLVKLPPYVPAASAPPKHPPLAPLEKKLKRKLSSGRLGVDDALDLHGMTQAEAHRALNGFLWRAAENGFRLVLIVTGKGAADHAGERGVLRRMTPHWLRDKNLRPIILSIEEAGRFHGGSGALYVRLRRRGETA